MGTAAKRSDGGVSEVSAAAAAGEPLEGVSTPETQDPTYLTELKYRDPKNLAAGKLASGIGIFSILLGAAEVLMPKRVARVAGIDPEKTNTVRAMGLREIGTGVSILRTEKPTAQLWARVAGDTMDLGLIASQAINERSDKKRLAVTAAGVIGVLLIDTYCARTLTSQDWTRDRINPKAPTTVGQTSARVPFNKDTDLQTSEASI